MRKIMLAVAALFITAFMTTFVITPAHALNSNCNFYGPTNNWRVCITINVAAQSDGSGSRLVSVTLSCGPLAAFESSPAVYGYFVRVHRPDGTVVWSKNEPNAHVPGDDCDRKWTPSGVTWAGNYADGVYFYKARLNNWPDADNQGLDVRDSK